MVNTVLIQIRIPEKLLKRIEKLCEEGYYRNKGDAIVDAIRHLLERYERGSGLGKLTEMNIMGKLTKRKDIDLADIRVDFDEEKIMQNLIDYFGTDNIDEIMNIMRRRT
ncbi:MAG: ribbon-helix-helix protein, CopG family [Candidatus Odinarchaeota archaeon]|nr:ribbon-helix-helix protein, CopG family [Candidatus Odinarchaeota archaeon]